VRRGIWWVLGLLVGLSLAAWAAAPDALVGAGHALAATLLPPAALAPVPGRVLLLSDEPEQVPGAGLLYADRVDGAFRVFLYAVAAGSEPLRLHVAALDLGPRPVDVVVTRLGLGGPSPNDALVAAQAEATFFADRLRTVVRLGPGRPVDLVPALPVEPAAPGDLVAALVDGASDGPVEVATVATTQPGLQALPAVPLPPARAPHGLLRGTFPAADFRLLVGVFPWQRTVALPAGAAALPGWSAVDGVPVRDGGGYGIVYRVRVATFGARPATLGLLASAAALRAAPWVLAAWGGPGPADALAPALGRLRGWLRAWTWSWLLPRARQVVALHWMAPAAVNLPPRVWIPLASSPSG
jgi:hypothetical protein